MRRFTFKLVIRWHHGEEKETFTAIVIAETEEKARARLVADDPVWAHKSLRVVRDVWASKVSKERIVKIDYKRETFK